MFAHKKKLNEQVIVVTGASSGIGLSTARLAAERGASVVLAARSSEALHEVVEKIGQNGGQASAIAVDIADEDAVSAIAEHAIHTYGRIDTWVNNAGIAIYGRLEEIALEDMRRMFDVTFWGVVMGSRIALPHLRQTSGTLINIGSVESDVSLPLIGVYAAAKHAVKAFTEALRMEVEKEGSKVAVTLIKPAAIDTPFFEHAQNYMSGDPNPAPPVYSPEVVARTILECAEHPVREVVVGGSGLLHIGMKRTAPGLSEKLIKATLFHGQQRPPRPDRDPAGALYSSRSNGRERGDYPGRVMQTSLSTYAALHPAKVTLAALSIGAALVGVSRLLSRA